MTDHPIFGFDFGVPGPTVSITVRQTTVVSDPRPYKFLDSGNIKPSIRLGWTAPIVLPAAPGYEIPDDEVWQINHWYAERRPFMERQARVHALWMLGWRAEAQRIYWQAKLKRKVKR